MHAFTWGLQSFVDRIITFLLKSSLIRNLFLRLSTTALAWSLTEKLGGMKISTVDLDPSSPTTWLPLSPNSQSDCIPSSSHSSPYETSCSRSFFHTKSLGLFSFLASVNNCQTDHLRKPVILKYGSVSSLTLAGSSGSKTAHIQENVPVSVLPESLNQSQARDNSNKCSTSKAAESTNQSCVPPPDQHNADSDASEFEIVDMCLTCDSPDDNSTQCDIIPQRLNAVHLSTPINMTVGRVDMINYNRSPDSHHVRALTDNMRVQTPCMQEDPVDYTSDASSRDFASSTTGYNDFSELSNLKMDNLVKTVTSAINSISETVNFNNNDYPKSDDRYHFNNLTRGETMRDLGIDLMYPGKINTAQSPVGNNQCIPSIGWSKSIIPHNDPMSDTGDLNNSLISENGRYHHNASNFEKAMDIPRLNISESDDSRSIDRTAQCKRDCLRLRNCTRAIDFNVTDFISDNTQPRCNNCDEFPTSMNKGVYNEEFGEKIIIASPHCVPEIVEPIELPIGFTGVSQVSKRPTELAKSEASPSPAKRPQFRCSTPVNTIKTPSFKSYITPEFENVMPEFPRSEYDKYEAEDETPLSRFQRKTTPKSDRKLKMWNECSPIDGDPKTPGVFPSAMKGIRTFATVAATAADIYQAVSPYAKEAIGVVKALNSGSDIISNVKTILVNSGLAAMAADCVHEKVQSFLSPKDPGKQ